MGGVLKEIQVDDTTEQVRLLKSSKNVFGTIEMGMVEVFAEIEEYLKGE